MGSPNFETTKLAGADRLGAGASPAKLQRLEIGGTPPSDSRFATKRPGNSGRRDRFTGASESSGDMPAWCWQTRSWGYVLATSGHRYNRARRCHAEPARTADVWLTAPLRELRELWANGCSFDLIFEYGSLSAL